MPTITLNGKEHEIGEGLSITQMLSSLEIPRPGTAVAVNKVIVPRERHETHVIRAGDRIEIVRAIGGG